MSSGLMSACFRAFVRMRTLGEASAPVPAVTPLQASGGLHGHAGRRTGKRLAVRQDYFFCSALTSASLVSQARWISAITWEGCTTPLNISLSRAVAVDAASKL